MIFSFSQKQILIIIHLLLELNPQEVVYFLEKIY